MTAAPTAAAMYRGSAPRGCAESIFRITCKTLGMARPHRNTQNVLFAGSAGDANGGIQGDTSPIGVGTAPGGLASSGDRGAATLHLRRARFPCGGRAVRVPCPPPPRDPEASGVAREGDGAASHGSDPGSR